MGREVEEWMGEGGVGGEGRGGEKDVVDGRKGGLDSTRVLEAHFDFCLRPFPPIEQQLKILQSCSPIP